MIDLDLLYLKSVVSAALAEDIGSGDITTLLTVPGSVPPHREAHANIMAKQPGIIAGIETVKMVFSSGILEGRTSGVTTEVRPLIKDGHRIEPGDYIALIDGQPRTILTGERVALNFIQRLSGIATLTARYVELVSHTRARITDTRKTTPGLRKLEKYAVTVGGGINHRFGLDDGVLIKDNHISAAGGIANAVSGAKMRAPHTLKIEVEVSSLEQLSEAIDAGADIVMLDNMSIDNMRRAVQISSGKVLLEASGGVNLDSVRQIAETGVDIISVGALTHSAPALDISLNFK